jgi:putative autotransporter adhesin-like protein
MERRRSLFWPLFLIAAGAIWLLVKAGTIPSANLWALAYIWPFVLIAAGVAIILRSYWRYATILLDVVIIGGAVLAIFYAPRLGWATPPLSMINIDGPFIGPSERGSGNVVSETRDVGNFHAIDVNYPAQVLVKQGTKESFKIEAEDNLLPDLKTQVQNGVLEISYNRQSAKRVNPTKAVKITIVVKDLDKVEFTSAGELTVEKLATDSLDVSLSGAGNVELNDIQTKDLHVSLSGAGSMTASGTTDSLVMNISGFGDFKGGDLHAKNADVNISGAGSATVWVDEDLTAQISGAGSVSYYGSASVTRQVSGVGGVNHLGNK